jgi:hypothetical protein
VSCLLFSWGSGLRVTADQRTTDGDSAFDLLGCKGCFGVSVLFLWLRIPVMGAGNSFCFIAHGGGDPGIENDQVGAFDIWVFEQN